ncbi:hypothetical protein ACFV1N_21145 [Streptosporangium canum]
MRRLSVMEGRIPADGEREDCLHGRATARRRADRADAELTEITA